MLFLQLWDILQMLTMGLSDYPAFSPSSILCFFATMDQGKTLRKDEALELVRKFKGVIAPCFEKGKWFE